MRNLVKIGLIACLMLGLDGCAEKELQIKRNFSTSTTIYLNKDGSIGLGDEEKKLILPTCPKKIFIGGYSFTSTDKGDDKDTVLSKIANLYVNENNLKDIYSDVSIENKNKYDSHILFNTACVNEKSKDKTVDIYSEYIETNLVDK